MFVFVNSVECGTMPRTKYWKKGKAHQSLEDKNEMRQMDRKENDDLLTENERKGLNFPKKAENGLNFPKKAENGLNFPKKAENGLNFPKKAENGLNFPKKADSVAKKPCTDTVAKKPCTDSVVEKPCIDDFAKNPCTESVAKKHCAETVAKKHCTETVANHFANFVTETNSMSSSNITETKLLPDTLVYTNISQFKQIIVDLKETINSNMQTDFDKVILESFPDVVPKCQSGVIENPSERENIASSPQNEMLQMHTQNNKKITAQHHFNSDSSETCLDNEMVCYQAIRSSEQLWNAGDLVFGSFHQNDVRFSEQSRGYQCTCNALCMLSYSLCYNVYTSLILDEVLCEGDVLYQTVINRLKSKGKFVHHLLSLEEIPDNFEIKMGKFTVEKMPILCGPLIDTQNLGLPTLHDTLQLAFMSVSFGLITIGAICSAVFRKNDMYVFFDSHSHGENGLSSIDGSSCLITFSSIDDLVTYMYALYDSLNLNTNLQFDFLPIKIKKNEETQSYKDQMDSSMEAYFRDQKLRQANKTQSKVQSISNCTSNTLIKESRKELRTSKFKHRTEYYKNYKRKCRQNEAFRTKERESKQSARKDPVFQTRERESKQSARKHPSFKAKEAVYQKKSKQSARKDPVFQTRERELKQSARKDPSFKAKETVYQKESKQSARKDPVFQTRERELKQSARKDPSFKAKETVYQKESKQSARKDPMFQTRERELKQSARKDPSFKAKETVYQKESKQSARKDPMFQTRERELKQSARKDPSFKAKETVYQKKSKQLARENQAYKTHEKVFQNKSKKKARENAYVRECERIKKQQVRQEKRKFDGISEIISPRKRYKHDTDNFPETHRKDLKTIKEAIKQFHLDISIGPLYVCSCCHQTWFRKSVSMLKNTHIPAESKRLHCTDFISVNNEEWICHTCLSALRDSKIPKLSVTNGMKWPIKPPELNLHQLEERLIALRIPFMQIRELPRGGQYSLKGNVINVPVDIQPTINCLPRPMNDDFTVAIQLKKKLSYKTVDFKENVRPLRVLTALHWLMNNSKLYKNSGIVIDDDWFQEVTESAEETVREFLGNSRESTNGNHSVENKKQEESTSKQDTDAPAGYDSDHYSEVDANDHVGNIDTLVDDADIDNKCDKVFTFAPGEGQHPLSLYNDKDAEYLCFPSIFCGQTPPSKEERIVPL